jgi:hypothetical protein
MMGRFTSGENQEGGKYSRPTDQIRIKTLRDVLVWASGPWGMTEPVVL